MKYSIPSDCPIQDVSDQSPLLRVHHLIIALLQLPEDLDVVDVHGGIFLECCTPILKVEYTQYLL